MSEVNRERVQLLVDALRSGRFQQGTGRLAKAGRYCCLGVACVVAQENGLALTTQADEDGDVNFGLGEVDSPNWIADSDYSHLPSSVQRWYGFDENDPTLNGDDDDGAATNASSWNDDYDRDFEWIADAFERTFLRDEAVG
jgi:hypothetical protein